MNDRKRAVRYGISFVILAVLLIFLFIWNVNSGSIHLSVKEILNIIFRHQGDETSYNIVWEIRLPRILAVIILGGALSVSGFLLQTFFNNPIAGPFVLGISSGAKLIVALLMIFFLSRSVSIGSGAMILAAFAGSMISMGFVLLVAKKVHNMSMLVISGVMIGYICSAITDFVVTFADDSNIVNLHNWSLGSFSGMTWGNVQTMAVVVLLTMVIVFFMSKPISAYQLGETYAQNMGVNIKAFRILLILLSSILSACVTAFAGPISFVGIAVPHIAKSLLKTAKPLLVIPACFHSSGAKLIVALLMIFFLSRSVSIGSGAMILAAFAGSMISMGFVLLVAKKVHNMSMLVISGVMIGYICSAITDFVVTFADDSNIVNLHNWSLGSFSGMTWGNVQTMAVVVLLTMVIVFFMSKPISAYQLGETYAQNMGVNIKVFRILLILLSSILSACVTAFAGPISFVGIAVPHIAKSLLKTAKPLLVIPACFLGGAVFCLFCDLIARTVFAPTELSISSVTAVFGAPVVIYIMIHRQQRI